MSQTFSPEDRVVVVMGPTGAGKSTFIECATLQCGPTVGHRLRSCTADVRAVRYAHPTDGYPVVFVDTPGFDDTYKSDVEILAMIADWLVKIYEGRFNLATIIYVHAISSSRMTGSMLKNLELFASLCGQKAMPNVILTTTKWEYVSLTTGTNREEELRSEFWKDMLNSGCRTERFQNTYDSAWRIIDSLVEKDRAPVLVSSEIVDAQLRLNETKAGITLTKELEKLIKDRQLAAQKLQKQLQNQENSLAIQQLNEHKVENDKKIQRTAEELCRMRIPFTRKIVLFFRRNLAGFISFHTV